MADQGGAVAARGGWARTKAPLASTEQERAIEAYHVRRYQRVQGKVGHMATQLQTMLRIYWIQASVPPAAPAPPAAAVPAPRDRMEDQLRALMADTGRGDLMCAICLDDNRPELAASAHPEAMTFVSQCCHAFHLRCLHGLKTAVGAGAGAGEAKCPTCRCLIGNTLARLPEMDPEAPETRYTLEALGLTLRENEAAKLAVSLAAEEAASGDVIGMASRHPGVCKACFGTYERGEAVARNKAAPVNAWVHLRCAERTDFACHHCALPVPAHEKMFTRHVDKVFACPTCALAHDWPAARREHKRKLGAEAAPRAGARRVRKSAAPR